MRGGQGVVIGAQDLSTAQTRSLQTVQVAQLIRQASIRRLRLFPLWPATWALIGSLLRRCHTVAEASLPQIVGEIELETS